MHPAPTDFGPRKDLALIMNQSGPLGTRLERASERILDMVQDFVVLNTRSPWPVPEGTGSTEGSYLPPPGVSIKENTLHLVRGTI